MQIKYDNSSCAFPKGVDDNMPQRKKKKLSVTIFPVNTSGRKSSPYYIPLFSTLLPMFVMEKNKTSTSSQKGNNECISQKEKLARN